MSRRRTIIAAALAAVTVQAAAFGVYKIVEGHRSAATGERFPVEVLAGDRAAPDLVVERPDGTRATLSDQRGRPVLVHFWATWCPPCIEELPGLIEAGRRLEGQGLVVLAVSMDDSWPSVRAFFHGEVPREVVRAVDPEASHQYDVSALPDTYLVSASGRLLTRYGGARPWRSRAAMTHLEKTLSAAAAR